MIGPIDVTQEAEEHVEHNHWPGVADMREVIDRRATDIHPHIARIDRFERGLPARQRVVERKCHVSPNRQQEAICEKPLIGCC